MVREKGNQSENRQGRKAQYFLTGAWIKEASPWLWEALNATCANERLSMQNGGEDAQGGLDILLKEKLTFQELAGKNAKKVQKGEKGMG